MTWGRFDDRMPRHCKYAPLSDAAFRLAIHTNLWSREMESGGFVPQSMLPHLVSFGGRKLKRAIDELVRAGTPLHETGIWRSDDAGEGWWIHDFDDYGPRTDRLPPPSLRPDAGDQGYEVDPELSRKRAEAGRRGGLEAQRRRASGELESSPIRDAGPVRANEQVASSKVPGIHLAVVSSKIEATSCSDLNPDPNPDPKQDPPTPQSEQTDDNEAKTLSGQPASKRELSSDEQRAPEVCEILPPIAHRAQAFLRDPAGAELRWGSPHVWPELEALWAAFKATWNRQDRPRQSNDPRVRAVIALYANGRTQGELERAIRASKRYKVVAENPGFQRIKTILKDDEQVDNLLRLEGLAQGVSRSRQHGRQVGGWQPPTTEVGT